MSEQEKQFLNNYEESLDIFKKHKKDFLLTSFLHYEFCRDNPELEQALLKAKLKVIINTYRSKTNKNFTREIYSQCEFVWKNVNMYILNCLGQASEMLIEKNGGSDNKKDISELLGKAENVTKYLSLKKTKVFDMIKYLKRKNQ